jgi:hypothetical protein
MLDLIPFLLACMLVALPVAADDALWEWVTPRPQGHDLRAAAAGDGVTVAVGGKGTVITCTDGIEWRMSHTDADYSFSDVVWGKEMFVAVGGEVGFEFSPGLGVILTSEDGFNWIERHREDYLTLEAVAWTGTRFVAVGIGDRVLLSSDGSIWTEVQFADSEYIWDLEWNGSQLVAIGRDGYFGGLPSYFTSDDGEAWQEFPFDRAYAPSSIAASGSRFVVVGSEHEALVSDDGQVWTEVPYEAQSELEWVEAGGGGFLAVGRNVVGTSPDGYVWTLDYLPTESRVNGLSWSGDGYLAVGEDGFMMSSPEGSVWTRHSERAFDISGTWEINELVKGGPTIIGVGEGGIVLTGNHATEWERRASPAESGLNSVIWTGSAFWAVGWDRIIRSTDGTHWSEMYLDSGAILWDIVWNGEIFVAVGSNASHTDAQKLILTSEDGHHWSSEWFNVEDHFFTVGWTGSRFVVAGRGSACLTSTDGSSWDLYDFPADITLLDFAWNGDRLVGVGGRSESGGVVLTTANGIDWLESSLPEPMPSWFEDVAWTGTHFVAVSRSSGDVIFASPDGLAWSAETTGTGVWPVSVVGDERSLVVTGRGLKIIRRTEPLADPIPPRRPSRRAVPVAGKALRVPSVQR